MEYIAHQRYSGVNMNGKKVLIRYKDKLERRGDVIYFNDTPICIYRSLVGKQHFSINEDGRGLERGNLTYKIAYSKRGDGSQRFTDSEIELLETKYNHLLKPTGDVILFNDTFFELEVEKLEELAKELNIEK